MGLRAAWLLTLVLSCAAQAPTAEASRSGAMYRCTDAAGAVAFQDRPCESARGEDRIEGGEPALRRWLESQRGAPARPTARGATSAGLGPARSPSTPAGRAELAAIPAPVSVSERRLAICSERFLACAHGDSLRMDRCVAQLPRCGGGSAACCPASCLDRYAELRSAGNALADAVSGALFGALGCGAVQ